MFRHTSPLLVDVLYTDSIYSALKLWHWGEGRGVNKWSFPPLLQYLQFQTTELAMQVQLLQGGQGGQGFFCYFFQSRSFYC